MPGMSRIGSTDTNGFDGQITTARTGPRSAAASSGFTAAVSMPANSKPVTAGAHRSRTK